MSQWVVPVLLGNFGLTILAVISLLVADVILGIIKRFKKISQSRQKAWDKLYVYGLFLLGGWFIVSVGFMLMIPAPTSA